MKKIICIIIAIMLLLTACGKPSEPARKVRVGALTGPTAMGLLKLMESGEYEFTLKSEATAFSSALAKGEIDIAAMPANLAAVIYNNTDGAIKLLAANTLGVLYIVERGDAVHSLDDLAGRTLYATGEGAVPEFTLRYLTDRLAQPVVIRWCADTTEVLAYLALDENGAAMLPQPFVTVAQTKMEDLRVAIDLGELWNESGTDIVTGVVVVRTEFAENHPEAVEKFMRDYRESVNFALNDTNEAARLIGKYEIVPEAVAKKALPECNICCIEGTRLRSMMDAYLTALFEMYPQSVGGKLPNGEFYYE